MGTVEDSPSSARKKGIGRPADDTNAALKKRKDGQDGSPCMQAESRKDKTCFKSSS
jgi:hypothetical protein